MVKLLSSFLRLSARGQWLLVGIFFIPIFTFCNSQGMDGNNNPDKALENREAAVAGKFYPADTLRLEKQVKNFFASVQQKQQPGKVKAVISPHAGYPFSGAVAATAIAQLPADPGIVFLLGASHHGSYEGASVYSAGHYEMPFGEIKVDLDLARELVENHDIFQFNPTAHEREHSLEVQLPFLYYHLKKPFKIVPILVGTRNANVCKDIAKALAPYFNEHVFVVSTDFSHYPRYDDAKIVDRKTAEAIATKKPEHLINQLEQNSQGNTPELVTSLCGWSAVLSLMYITENKNLDVHLLHYQNSGDTPYGGKSRVVGYHAISYTEAGTKKAGIAREDEFFLQEEDKKQLLQLARETLSVYLSEAQIPPVKDISPKLETPCGAFVTLRKDGELRGCIGSFQVTEPLYQVVQQMTISAATRDHRFTRVSLDELDELEIEISVLSPMKKIDSIDEIEMGKHGVYIKKGLSSGTFLPQVATETGWSKEEFLGHCARDKARIGWNGWKKADIYVYQAYVFEESEFEE